MEAKSVVKPVHIALGVGAIIAALIVLPIAGSIWSRAYPPIGSTERFLVDECAKKEGDGVRWDAEALAMCKAMNALRRRYGS